MMERVIIVERLVKNFEVIEREGGLWGALTSVLFPKRTLVEALREISLSVNEGELVGFIGPNGAGKTTTLKILSGVLYPTRGFVQVNGYKPWERKTGYLKEISLVMGQKNQLWWDLPALSSLELTKAIYEIPDRTYQKNLRELTNLLDVEELLGRQVRRLSLGQRMRLELVSALVHRPKTIFMDEPTIGLDVIGQQRIRKFISDYNKRFGATIILTSHNMDDLYGVVSRVVVISNGKIVFDGKFKELIEKFATEKIVRVIVGERVENGRLEKLGKVVKNEFPEIVIEVPRKVSRAAASELLQNYPVEEINIEEMPIDQVVGRFFVSEK